MDIGILPKITLDMQVKPQLLYDIVITACEGGIGYWSELTTYHWRGLPFPDAVIVSVEDPEDFPETTITPELVTRGIQLALNPNATHGLHMRDELIEAIVSDDSSQLDCNDCDNIVQLGMFGEIRYS